MPVEELAAPGAGAGREKGAAKSARKAERSAGRVTVQAQGGSPDLNLIGKTVDEALAELDRAVDRALVAGLSRLRVIHGRGEGALRRAIRGRVDEDPGLARIEPEEQDDAVTWIEVQ